MTLKENVINTMREELNSITDNNPTEDTLGIISNRRAFAKTETYRKLRKNELSNEEMYFLLNNYKYGSKEIAEFLVDAISDFTAEKLVAIGGIESILTEISHESNYFWYLTNALIDNFKIDNPSKSLNVILKYLTAAEKVSSDIMGVNNAMNIIIERRFSPHINRELVPKSNQPVYNEKEKELIMAIKDNYPLIFNLTSNRQKREEEKGFESLRIALWGNDLNNISRYISDNYSNQVSKMACFLIKTFRKCPYIEIDFVIDYINTQTKLPKEVQLIVLYTLLCSQNLDPIIDFDKTLKYCENLYKKSGISKGLHEILALITERNVNNFDIFIERVSNLNSITKERSNEIYKYYFKNQSKMNNTFTEESLKLKAMINLKVSDLEIAEEVRKLSQRGINTYCITSNFHCNPEKPYTYPGFHTMKEIMILGLTDMNLYNKFEQKNFANMSYKDLVQEFFFKYYKNFDGKVVITWKMANNPTFIKSLLMELNDRPYIIGQIMKMINIKNIGFKKYMDILEDIQRNLNNDRLFVSNKYTSAEFHQKALRFATESEINMYKHKIPTSLLLSSRYCTYKVFDYFLKRIESNKVSKDVVSDIVFSIVRGVRNNEKLTQEQQIDILVRIGEKPVMVKFYIVERSKSKTIAFNVPNSKNLTVKDFQNYYSKIREVK